MGVNFASNKYDPSKDFSWATPEYGSYGYAELIDLYTTGNYYVDITIDDYKNIIVLFGMRLIAKLKRVFGIA